MNWNDKILQIYNQYVSSTDLGFGTCENSLVSWSDRFGTPKDLSSMYHTNVFLPKKRQQTTWFKCLADLRHWD